MDVSTNKKRRSFVGGTRSFFLRKSLCPENEVWNKEEYKNLLRKEYTQWKALSSYKAKAIAALHNKKPVAVTEQQILIQLDPEEKMYLEEAPSYADILNGAKQYVTAVLISDTLEENLDYQHEATVERFHLTKTRLMDSLLLELSRICLECNNSFCTLQIHPLQSATQAFYEKMVPLEKRIDFLT